MLHIEAMWPVGLHVVCPCAVAEAGNLLHTAKMIPQPQQLVSHHDPVDEATKVCANELVISIRRSTLCHACCRWMWGGRMKLPCGFTWPRRVGCRRRVCFDVKGSGVELNLRPVFKTAPNLVFSCILSSSHRPTTSTTPLAITYPPRLIASDFPPLTIHPFFLIDCID